MQTKQTTISSLQSWFEKEILQNKIFIEEFEKLLKIMTF